LHGRCFNGVSLLVSATLLVDQGDYTLMATVESPKPRLPQFTRTVAQSYGPRGGTPARAVSASLGVVTTNEG
jgi:hypothetical protein